jgi:hypothetical protein
LSTLTSGGAGTGRLSERLQVRISRTAGDVMEAR